MLFWRQLAWLDRMHHDIQDSLAERNHVLASSIINQKRRWRLLWLPIACVSSHRLHVMLMLLHVRLHAFSHLASEVQSGYCNNLIFNCMSAAMTSSVQSATFWEQESVTVTGGCTKRGAQVVVHGTDGQNMCSWRRRLGTAKQLWVLIVPAVVSVTPGPLRSCGRTRPSAC